jgi:hypothetical protein
MSLTSRLLKSIVHSWILASISIPVSYRMKIWRIRHIPVVVIISPAIKVNQQFPSRAINLFWKYRNMESINYKYNCVVSLIDILYILKFFFTKCNVFKKQEGHHGLDSSHEIHCKLIGNCTFGETIETRGSIWSIVFTCIWSLIVIQDWLYWLIWI